MRRPSLPWVVGLLACTSLGACGGATAPHAPESQPEDPVAVAPTPDPGPPSIVLVLADDMGWGDLGSYGNTKIRTPNLDRLASEGVRFTSFYVAAPVCAPSRASLMTGRWPPSTGIAWNPPDRLGAKEVVIAEVLRSRGYATGMVGKWHLGWAPEEMPVHRGFDYFYGLVAGDDSTDFILGDQPTSDAVGPAEFASRFTEYALRFIAASGARPFFMYIAHRDPHLPNYPPAGYGGRSGGGAYGDTVEWLDVNIGALMKGLRDLGRDQNTLVVFTSDNGPAAGGPGSTGPLHGGKGSCEEGGIRVPGLMRWPARIRAGRVVDEPVSTLDLFPTFVALAGAERPARTLHGQDVSRLITGEVDRMGGRGIEGGRELVFWQQGGKPGGLRSGRYKYLRPGFWNTSPTLFDLSADPGEQRDLVPSQPALAGQLESRLQQILDES